MARPRHHVLVVGAGSIGERHIRCFLATGRAAVSFVEVRAELRNEIAQRYPQARSYANLEEAMGGATVAVIATPAPLHVPQATALLQRGLHVLIEKPLAVTLAGVDALIALAHEKRGIVGVAYVYRAHPILGDMREALQSGKFGKPLELVAVCGQHFPLYRSAYRQTYYTQHETGGGAVHDALTHIVNAGEWLIGPVSRLVADTSHQVLEGTDVEDTVHVLARHELIPASYSLNQHQAPNETTITVVCERGTVRFETHTCRWREMQKPGGEWTDHGGQPLERDELFIRQADAFLDAVEGKVPVACSLDDGIQTLRVNLAILESARGESWQNVS